VPIAATSTLTVCDEGWQRPRTIPASQVVATWAINQPATLSAIVTMADVARLGRTDLIGAWVSWEHPIQGTFGGVIDDDPFDLDNGTIALTATGIGESLLMDRTTPVLLEPDTGHAGALIRRAMTLSQTADPLPFRSVQWDESGPVAEVEWRGEPIWDVIQNVLDQTGQEMQITIDRDRNIDLVIREQIGTDRTASVLIAEGYQVAGGRIDHSRLSVTNDITGIAADEDWERSANARIENETSRARYGRRQAVRRYENVVSPLSVKAKVRTDIRNEAVAPYLPTITLPPMHKVGLKIREGDTIRYWSKAANRETLFRVYSRTIRDEALELAGIAQEVRVPPVVPPFTPDVLSGLRMWLDASDRSTVTLAGSSVTRWTDKSPVGGQSVGGTGSYSIPYTYDPAIRAWVVRVVEATPSDGTNIQGTMSLGTTSAATVFAVARNISAGAEAIFTYPSAVPDMHIGGATDGTGAIVATVRSTAGTRSIFQHTNSMGSTVYHLLSATFDLSLSTNESTAWDNGTSSGTRPSNGNNAGPMSSSNTIYFPGNWHLAEIIIYNRVLSTNERQAVESYLRKHWGIA